MPVVCRKIVYGRDAARQPTSGLRAAGSATVESKSRSSLVSRFMRHRMRPFDRALRRTFEGRLQSGNGPSGDYHVRRLIGYETAVRIAANFIAREWRLTRGLNDLIAVGCRRRAVERSLSVGTVVVPPRSDL
jgi:hypothetical protein